MANGPDYWSGQKNINGMLCGVDWRIIAALREVRNILASSGANVSVLDQKISEADELSAKVALEDPPGCNPQDPQLAGLPAH